MVEQKSDTKDIVIVISSQSNKYHLALAEDLKRDIYKQAQDLDTNPPTVHLSHQDFPHVGGWTILPVMPRLMKLHSSNCSWFVFIEDRTRIRLKELVQTLEKHNQDREMWLGYVLQDREPTIIHHFAFSESPAKMKYPNTASGFAVSRGLMHRLVDRWKTRTSSPFEFSIDHAYELALFIWNNGDGPTLENEVGFCISDDTHCATIPIPFKPCEPYKMIPKESIYFAVKTCQKFHEDRVPVVKSTWGRQTPLISFFSDVEDKSIPTISLGIPNAERGHCEKTLAIIKYVAKNIQELPEIKWIVIADDDTILSVARLQELLTCYDSATPVALGERYGYNVCSKQGYNYITGGGGIVLSRVLLEMIAAPNTCECPNSTSPDDMFLGVCIARLKVDITHSPVFHQARPMDYTSVYLNNQPAVSFHKHWMVNPLSLYQKWFSAADLKTSSSQHTEL